MDLGNYVVQKYISNEKSIDQIIGGLWKTRSYILMVPNLKVIKVLGW